MSIVHRRFRGASRHPERCADASRHLQDASETPLRHEFGAKFHSVDVIFGSFLVPLCDTYIDHPFGYGFGHIPLRRIKPHHQHHHHHQHKHHLQAPCCGLPYNL